MLVCRQRLLTILSFSGNEFMNNQISLFTVLTLVLVLGCTNVTALKAAGSRAPAPQDAESTPLEPGRPIERELVGDGSHSYSIAITAGQFLYVIVDQKGIDVVVTLFAPDGKKLAERDSPNGTKGPEALAIVIEASATYRLEVRSLEKTAAAGRYEVKIEQLRAGTEKDRNWVRAHNTFAEAELLRAQGTAASLRSAIAKYEESLPYWRATDDRASEAGALNNIGGLNFILGETQKAIDYYNQAVTIKLEVGDRLAAGRTLSNIGSIHTRMGEVQKALDAFDQSLSLIRAVGDSRTEAGILNNIGNLYFDQSEWQKALDHFNQSLAISRAKGDRISEATTINNIGGVYNTIGEKAKALDSFNQALAIYGSTGLRANEAATLNNIGMAYSDLGQRQKALDYYNQALPISRATGDKTVEANALLNLGNLYRDLGVKQTSLDYYNQSLSLYRATRDRIQEAVALNNIGLVNSDLGDKQKALDYFNQALSLARAIDNRLSEARTLTNMGSAYLDLDEKQKALEIYERALPLRRAVGDRRGEAITLNNIGLVYSRLGERQKALDYYNQALVLKRAIGDRNGEASTLYLAAHVEKDLGNLIAARTQIEECLKIVEELRTSVTSQELRASYLSTVQNYYRFYIDLLMRMHRQQASAGFNTIALQASESGRARSLLELLNEAHADIRQGVDAKLLDRERSLQQLLRDKTELQVRLLNGGHTAAQAVALTKELEALRTDYRQLEAQIRASSPRYASLTQPQPLSANQIQHLLDKDTLLLEYALGEDCSYLWAVSQSAIKSYELPKRAQIETAAKEFYASLTTPNQQQRNVNEKRGLRLGGFDGRQPADAAASLSQMLLAPVASHLGNKRLIIVADGALMYVPFSALSLPRVARGRKTSKQAPGYRPLMVDHEVVNLPSASTLAILRQETAGRKMALKTVAVLADPVFGTDDERVTAAENSRPLDNGATKSVEESRFLRASAESSTAEDRLRIQRLPGTRQEAERIASFAPRASLKLLDFDASLVAAHSTDLAQYRYVHFATHGFLNSVSPELSGIVLSMVDREGRRQAGFLLTDEVFNLHLPAEMIVLSACQTGLGKEVKGEGLVGLTRGFMYAGAPRVIVSLWNVSDKATSEMMVRLYRGVLKEHLSAAAALRAAQVQMWKQKRWRKPYYWASFVLQGEWR
jgi:CHAT domain-containing protein/tetratricopeptide (TPR) repeat protein